MNLLQHQCDITKPHTFKLRIHSVSYSRNLTNNTSVVPKLASSLFTSALFVASKAANNFATCSLVLPRGGSREPTVVFTGGFCKHQTKHYGNVAEL